jgi:hypothetical protein
MFSAAKAAETSACRGDTRIESTVVRNASVVLVKRVVCVFITAGPFTKLCAWGRRRVEDMCYEIRRAEACVD